MGRIAKDLRDWIRMLDEAGELARVSVEVDPHLEITEVTDRTTKAGGPALLFEHPTGSQLPVLTNQFGSDKRICMAFGVDSLDEVATKISDILELQPPQGIGDKFRTLGKLRSLASAPPKYVKKAPCQEVVLRGEEASLDELPILTCWPQDGGPYVTLPLVFTKDPETGARNCGMYRIQKFDARTTGMHWQIHKDGAEDWRTFDAKSGGGDRLEVAVALGTDPIVTYAATAPLPKHIDEMLFAGFLRGDSVELVKCVSVDIEVPANAEIVIEGYIQRGELAVEGPFGDHTGYYSLADLYPVFHVTAITRRADAIYPATIVGRPPQEDCWLAKATERIFLPLVKTTMPEVVDYNLPWDGVFHGCAIFAIKKRYPGHAKKIMHAVWGTGLMSLTKTVIVVDEHVNVHDYHEVAFRVFANMDPQRDVLLSEGPIDVLDHATNLLGYGGKLGIDATTKLPNEGFTRDWPADIVMSDEVMERVDARWDEYGIGVTGARDSWGVVRGEVPTPAHVREFVERAAAARRQAPAATTGAPVGAP
jgi:4-hydroxy-3-polyprenylbenzoate decarboxylase